MDAFFSDATVTTVLAGAGSGKSTTLVQRVLFMETMPHGQNSAFHHSERRMRKNDKNNAVCADIVTNVSLWLHKQLLMHGKRCEFVPLIRILLTGYPTPC